MKLLENLDRSSSHVIHLIDFLTFHYYQTIFNGTAFFKNEGRVDHLSKELHDNVLAHRINTHLDLLLRTGHCRGNLAKGVLLFKNALCLSPCSNYSCTLLGRAAADTHSFLDLCTWCIFGFFLVSKCQHPGQRSGCKVANQCHAKNYNSFTFL